MKKKIKAVQPFIHPGHLNFKLAPYEAWKQIGGDTVMTKYPNKCFKGLFYKYNLPHFCISDEARLCFVEAYSVRFDTFPSYISNEIIPFVWDCWTTEIERFCVWLKKQKIKTAIFTCNKTARQIHEIFPDINILYCPEGVNSKRYPKGKPLTERKIDVFEFGRGTEGVLKIANKDAFVYKQSYTEGIGYISDSEFQKSLIDSKITICLPHSITNPVKTGGIETLTQRYWECMLSGMLMIGHAPQELIDLVGYNPVVEIDGITSSINQPIEIDAIINDILKNIIHYQKIVDKNRQVAEQMSDWTCRMKMVMTFLENNNYKI